jgi:uncharacterized metal-binding protein YceD (DUF177 family)
VTSTELTRPFPRSRVGEGATFVVEANPTERAALAQRMNLPEIHRLVCIFELGRAQGAAVPATGSLVARVTQTCVISLDPFDTDIAEDFAVRFVPAGTESDELDLDAVDEIPYEGDMLDLGEATAEQLALALDPFPRKPGAELPGHPSEADAGAFEILRKLRQRG